MNRNVCELCRRFGKDTNDRPNVWMCAQYVYLEPSGVIPGHSFARLDGFHYMVAGSPIPEWCERPLEQTILSPDEQVDIDPDDNHLVYDGNHLADECKKDRMKYGWTSDGLQSIHR